MEGAAARSGLRRGAGHGQAHRAEEGVTLQGCAMPLRLYNWEEGRANLCRLLHLALQADTTWPASPHERRIIPHPFVHAPGCVCDGGRRVASSGCAGGQAQQIGRGAAPRLHLLGVLINKVTCSAE